MSETNGRNNKTENIAFLETLKTHFHKIIDKSPLPMVIADTKSNILYVNEKFTETFDYTLEDIPDLENWVKLAFPDENYRFSVLEKGKDAVSKAKVKGRSVDKNTYMVKTKSGKIEYVEFIYNVLDKYWLFMFNIVTQKKKSEVVNSVLYNISNATYTTKNPAELFRIIRQQLNRLIDTTNMYIASYNKDTDKISLAYRKDETDESTEFPRGKTLTGYVIKTKKPLRATKKIMFDLVDEGEIQIVGVPAKVWVGVPLIVEGETIGVLSVQSYTNENLYSEDDVELLEFASYQIALAIQRKSAEDALRSSEERLRAIFNNAVVGISIVEPNGKVIFANRNWLEMLGYTKQELSDLAFNEMSPEEDAKKTLDLTEKIIKGEIDHFHIEKRYIRKNKSRFWAHLSASAINNEKGEVEAIVGIVVDIDEQKRNAAEIQEQNAFLQTLLDTLPSPFYHKDKKGRLVGCNKNFKQFLGIEIDDDVSGCPITDYIDDDTAKFLSKNDDELYKTEKNQILDGRIKHSDGTYRDIIQYKSIFKDASGVCTGLIGILVDISEQKEAERQLLALEKKSSALAMAITANHELNQPLMGIKGYVGLLQKSLDTSLLKEHELKYIKKINESISKMTQILNKFKTSTSVEFGDYATSEKMVIFNDDDDE